MDIVKELRLKSSNSLDDTSKREESQEILGKAILKLISLLEQTRVFNKSELHTFSIFHNNPYIQPIIMFRILNAKHVKRLFAKDDLTALKEITRALQFNTYGHDIESMNWFDKKFRNKRM